MGFILKGGILFFAWSGQKFRPTKDLDFLLFGDLDKYDLLETIKGICCIPFPEDGINFLFDSFDVEDIKEDHEYEGMRVLFDCKIGNSKIRMKLDICTGDLITPEVRELDYPSLLELDSPQLKTYPKETVLAEKVQAMISLDLANSRMKDFYDVYIIVSVFSEELNKEIVKKAVETTFRHRGTELPPQPRVWK